MGAKEAPADGRTPSSDPSHYLCSDSVSVDGDTVAPQTRPPVCWGHMSLTWGGVTWLTCRLWRPVRVSDFTQRAAPRSPTLRSCSQTADLPQAEPELAGMSQQPFRGLRGPGVQSGHLTGLGAGSTESHASLSGLTSSPPLLDNCPLVEARPPLPSTPPPGPPAPGAAPAFLHGEEHLIGNAPPSE